jgi:hypothetical protein
VPRESAIQLGHAADAPQRRAADGHNVRRTQRGPMLNEKEVGDLLNRLCRRLGFCLPPDDIVRLREDPPAEVLAFTDAVFTAEGLDPETADRHLYRQVRDMIADAFHQAEYDGA